jgi:hypothetical protein
MRGRHYPLRPSDLFQGSEAHRVQSATDAVHLTRLDPSTENWPQLYALQRASKIVAGKRRTEPTTGSGLVYGVLLDGRQL